MKLPGWMRDKSSKLPGWLKGIKSGGGPAPIPTDNVINGTDNVVNGLDNVVVRA